MYIIVKEVNGNKYYWDKQKFCWYGIFNNASVFETEKGAESYKTVYTKEFKDAEIKKVLNKFFIEARKKMDENLEKREKEFADIKNKREYPKNIYK